MNEGELARAFESHRRHLQRVAYGLLGSLSEAEDVVQDAWLRLERVEDPAAIGDLRAWLTTVVSRLALDTLRSARARREQYVGTWLPEPLVRDAAPDPSDRVARDDEISLALLIVLERLSPAERGAFLLHDVFGYPFEEAARVLQRSPAATRQLASRGRAQVEAGRPRFAPSREEQRTMLGAFIAACTEGDLQRLTTLLAPDVVFRADGGGKVMAARRIQRGAAKVAHAMIALAARPLRAATVADVNGAPGLVLRDGAGVLTVISLTFDAGRIVAIDIVRNPDKLAAVPEPPPLSPGARGRDD